MSSVLHRAHFQFRNNSFIVVVMNVLIETVDEFINCLKMFTVKYFDFKPAEKVFHCTVIHTVAFSGHTLFDIMFG